MSRRRKVLRACFVSVLTLLGAVIYWIEPPEPMWEAKLERDQEAGNPGCVTFFPHHFSPDGKRLYTMTFEVGDAPKSNAKIPRFPIWDVATGTKRAIFVPRGESPHRGKYSDDGRFATQVFRDADARERIRLADLQSGRERALAVTAGWINKMHFSARGDWLVIFCVHPSRAQIYETANGQLVGARESAEPFNDGVFGDGLFGGDVLIYRRGPLVECWSLQARKPIGEWRLADASLSPDGAYLVGMHTAPTGGRSGSWSIWNLRTLAPPVGIARERNLVWPSWCGEKWLMMSYWEPPKAVHEFHKLPSGLRIDSLAVEGEPWSLVVSPDALIGVTYGLSEKQDYLPVQAFDLTSRKRIWEIPRPGFQSFPYFTADSARLILAPSNRDFVLVLDAKTGKTHAPIQLPRLASWDGGKVTPDSRTLLIHVRDESDIAPPESFIRKALKWFGIDPKRIEPKYNDFTIVWDLDSHRERFRLTGWNVQFPLLSDDGNTLATVHREEGDDVLRCWEVNALKPLRWPLGIPAGLGVTLVLLANAWRRWRRPSLLAAPR